MTIIAEWLSDLFGAWLGQKWARRRADKMLDSGRVECWVRVVEGQQRDVPRRWRHGAARVSPGRVEFDPWGPVGRTAEMAVENVSRLHQRTPGALERWLMNPDCRIVHITTTSAVIEWALLQPHLQWAVSSVRPAGP